MNWFATVIFAILEVALRSLRNAYTFVSNSRKIGSTLVGLGKMAKPRTRPCLAVALSIVLITCFTSLVTTVHASPANPGHPASSISAGTFESGNYVFPNNLTINSFLIVNTDTLYVDSISGKIGIGTETPYQELDVVGNINATGTINSTTDLCIQGGKCLSNMGVGTGDVTDVLAGWGITVTNSAGPQPRVNLSSTSAGNGLGYSQGILSVKTGNGIEISSDTVVLNQSCSDGQILKWESTGSYWYCAADSGLGSESDPRWTANYTARTGTGNVVFSTSPTLTTPTVQTSLTVTDDDWIGLGSSAGRIEFDNQATDEVNILNANVGIGTATPQQELDVVGDINATGTIYEGGSTLSAKYQEDVTGSCSGANFVQSIADGGAISCGSETYTATQDAVESIAEWQSGCTDCVGNTDLAANSVDLTSDALSSAYAGAGLGGGGSSALSVNVGNGIEISSDTVVLNQSCSDGEILKWESTGSYWYCAADENSGGSVSGTGTNHRLAYWTGASTINDLAAGNSGDVLESQGSGADPTWIAKSSLADTHTHDASNITSGTLSTGRYSAYSDLSAEGYLNNDNANDLLTRSQADTRFINDGGNEVGSDDISTGAVGADELDSGAVTATGTELDSSVAGNGLGLSSGALYVKTGNGIEISSDTVVLNQSCSDGQILKWESTGSYWYCAADSGLGSESDPFSLHLSGGQNQMSQDIDMNNNLITNIGNGGTDFTTGGGLTLAADLTVNGGDVSINNNNGGVNFNDASAFWLKTATNWGIYWDTGANTIEFTGSGTDRANVDLDNGNVQMDGDLTVSGGDINLDANGGCGSGVDICRDSSDLRLQSDGGDVIIRLG